jgi:hypothetical protein
MVGLLEIDFSELDWLITISREVDESLQFLVPIDLNLHHINSSFKKSKDFLMMHYTVGTL